MDSKIVYFDETGDDGNNTKTSDAFVLTSLSVSTSDWAMVFEKHRQLRKLLHDKYGFSYFDEFHTKPFLYSKNPYRAYGWSIEERRQIIAIYARWLASLNVSLVNVVIDKTKIRSADYDVLGKALTYNIQRVDNTSNGNWNYLCITDPGRTNQMRKTARLIRAYNPIPIEPYGDFYNSPIKYMIEDVLEKDSKDSCFIQMCDFVSYFVYQYHKVAFLHKQITGRPLQVISERHVEWVLNTLLEGGILNTRASKNEYGLVVYPK